MNASRDALVAAGNLERELLWTQPSEPHLEPELQLLGFCLRLLGDRQSPLEPLPRASIPE